VLVHAFRRGQAGTFPARRGLALARAPITATHHQDWLLNKIAATIVLVHAFRRARQIAGLKPLAQFFNPFASGHLIVQKNL
jgi:hypothetical protein